MPNLVDVERAKYEELWKSVPDYRTFSPGLESVERFVEVLQPKAWQSLYDVGCGTGGAGLEFAKRGLRVSYVDITDAGLDPQIDCNDFIQSTLWGHWARERHDYCYCCDVMEHIPVEYTMLCLDRIIAACDTAWIQITMQPDNFSAVIGQTLHLTVQPFNWWLERLRNFGKVTEARDICGAGIFVVTQ